MSFRSVFKVFLFLVLTGLGATRVDIVFKGLFEHSDSLFSSDNNGGTNSREIIIDYNYSSSQSIQPKCSTSHFRTHVKKRVKIKYRAMYCRWDLSPACKDGISACIADPRKLILLDAYFLNAYLFSSKLRGPPAIYS